MSLREKREIPTYDPWAGYQIRSHNKKYTGDANGVRFVDGIGVLNGLYADDDLQLRHAEKQCSCGEPTTGEDARGVRPGERDECHERIDQLMWFWNTNPLLKKVAVDPSDEDSPTEWRTFAAYLIEPYDPSVGRKRPQRDGVPITAREMAPAVKGGA